nr:immunoglobulin heavy chain junction region [Mus musculus]
CARRRPYYYGKGFYAMDYW